MQNNYLNITILQLKNSVKTYLFIQLLIIKYQIHEFVLKYYEYVLERYPKLFNAFLELQFHFSRFSFHLLLKFKAMSIFHKVKT